MIVPIVKTVIDVLVWSVLIPLIRIAKGRVFPISIVRVNMHPIFLLDNTSVNFYRKIKS